MNTNIKHVYHRKHEGTKIIPSPKTYENESIWKSDTVWKCRGWDLPDEFALQCFSTMSSWSVLAVRAARLWSVCMCVCNWWVWERVRKYSVTQESNVAACSFLTGSIVVEGDMFSWGKARPVLSPPPTPLTPHPCPSVPKPPHPHPRDSSNYTNCINCTVKEDRVGQSIPLQCFMFFINSTHSVCMCVYVYVHDVPWLICSRSR